MDIAISTLIGYLLGSLSPSALLGKLKHRDLTVQGTKNLGATNTMLVLGKKAGILVMLFDILKAFCAAKLAKWLFPELALAQLWAGLAAMVGHIFPFYMGFRGGKGLASFAGLILAYNPLMFCVLLALSIVLILIFNYGVAAPISAGVLFPIMAGLHSKNWGVFLLCAAAGVLLIIKHRDNLRKAFAGDDIKVRTFIRNGFSNKPKES